MNRLDKLALTELIPAFLFSLAAFIVLVILAVVMKPLIEIMTKYGVGADIVLKYFLLALPQWIVYTFPMAMLTGTILAVSRLSSNFEIVALRSAGISLYRFVLPFIVFAVLLSGLTFLLNEKLAPYTNRKLQELERELAAGKNGRVEEQIVSLKLFKAGKPTFFLFADSLKANILKNVRLFYIDQSGKGNDWYMTAKSANWVGDKWNFIDATIYYFQPDGTVLTTKSASATAEEFAMTPREIAKRSRDPSELTISELREVIKYQEKSDLPKSYIARFKVDYFFKFSIPVSPIFFVLIALPLAIMPVRTTTAMGMGYSILVLLVYIALMIISTQAGRGGMIPPALAAWIPNLFILIVGIFLIWLKNR